MVTEEQVRESLKNVQDPEIRMDIITLGLVYKIDISREGDVQLDMTFTSPMCPYGPALVDEVRVSLMSIEGVKTVEVNIVFDPPWEPSEEVKAVLGV